MGWICPNCGAGNAPTTPTCNCMSRKGITQKAIEILMEGLRKLESKAEEKSALDKAMIDALKSQIEELTEELKKL